VFELPDGQASLLPVASCVIVKSSSDHPEPLVGDNGKPVVRPYTPVSPSDHEGEIIFAVKKYDEGKMSKHIHDLQPGQSLAIKGPIMKIPYEGPSTFSIDSNDLLPLHFIANKWQEVGMIAGGSGMYVFSASLASSFPRLTDALSPARRCARFWTTPLQTRTTRPVSR
jgi:cytochrome-b5 reductase